MPAEGAEGASAAPSRPTLGPTKPASPRAPANPRRPAQAQARVSGNDTMLLRQMDAVLAALGDTTARVLAMEEREKQQNATIQQVTPRPRLHTLSDDPSKPSCCPALLNRVWARARAAADAAGGWRRRSDGGGCVADESRGREPGPAAGEAREGCGAGMGGWWGWRVAERWLAERGGEEPQQPAEGGRPARAAVPSQAAPGTLNHPQTLDIIPFSAASCLTSAGLMPCRRMRS